MRARRPWGAGPRASGGASKRPARSLKARAIALLARRDYSRAELRQKLSRLHSDADDALEMEVPRGETVAGEASRGGASDAAVPATRDALEALLDELAQLGFLSDERYAHSVVARKSASHSRRAIAEELKARGVASDAVRSAVEASEADDAATLRSLWQRRFGAAPRNDNEKARQVRFLQSRGFALSSILRFLRELPAAGDDA